MNKKRIVVYIIAVIIIAGSSGYISISKYSVDSKKNIVKSVAVEKGKVENEPQTGYISDEEAINVARKAMEYYVNSDTSLFIGTEITRFDYSKNTEIEVDGQKYMVSKSWADSINDTIKCNDYDGTKTYLRYALEEERPNVIQILFKKSENDDDKYKYNIVMLNAKTGEVIRVAKDKAKKEAKGEVDKNKIKEVIINTLDKANLKPDEEIDLNKMYVDLNWGRVWVYLNVDGGKTVQIDIGLDDFTVVTFYKIYIMYSSKDFQ